ncbi:ABC transporter permease [Vannielia litorea]|uniref:NitT/TauT family transport system permease protein n=1 Tax=Vannielia litorea TaxID=1217970 RepID=A0A1N6GTX3_9RHOB|nr:ABC transporter permease [Vannielia litorea]SIO10963.1 NitT/TauT family transport system permease protein [Vannielia litorea]
MALRNLAMGAAGFGIVFAVWYVIWLSGLVNRDLVPRPDEVLMRMIYDFREAGLLWDILSSVGRVLAGMSIGVTLAIPTGFVLAWYPKVGDLFQPVINAFRAIPPIALSPLVIVYLGIGEVARGSILVYAAFFTSLVVIYEGVSAIEEIYVRAARALGAKDREIFYKVAIPLVIPQVFVALRLALGVCWGTLVAAELLAAERGLGAVIQNAGNYFIIPDIYVGIACIGAIALAMDSGIRKLMRVAVSWQERVER